MQPFIEEKIALAGQSLPVGEGSWGAPIERGLFVVVNIMPGLAGAGFAIAAKHGFEFREKIGAGAEMAEITVAFQLLHGHHGAHFIAIVTMEGVSFDKGRRDALAPENLFEGAPHGCRSGPRRTGQRNHRIFRGHSSLFFFSLLFSKAHEAALPKQWRALGKLRIAMIAGDEPNWPRRAKDERHPRMDGGGDDVENRVHAVGRDSPRPFHD